MSEGVEIRFEGLAATRQSGLRLPWRLSSRPVMPLLLAAPLLLFMLVFYALPVLSMLMRSVNDPSWTLSQYASLTGDTVFLKVFSNTLYASLTVTGGPCCWAILSLSRWCVRRATRR